MILNFRASQNKRKGAGFAREAGWRGVESPRCSARKLFNEMLIIVVLITVVLY